MRSRSASQPSSNLPLYLSAHSLKIVVRAVRGAGRPVHEERLVGRERAVLAHPGDRLVGQVLAQVVRLVVRRLDRVEVLVEPRLPLRGLAGEEAVEVVEADALAGRPERRTVPSRWSGSPACCATCRRPRSCSRSAPSTFGERGRGPRDHAGVAVPVDRALGDGAGADALVVAPGQQRGARGRADRRGVEGVVADALVGEPRERRRVDRRRRRCPAGRSRRRRAGR